MCPSLNMSITCMRMRRLWFVLSYLESMILLKQASGCMSSQVMIRQQVSLSRVKTLVRNIVNSRRRWNCMDTLEPGGGGGGVNDVQEFA